MTINNHRKIVFLTDVKKSFCSCGSWAYIFILNNVDHELATVEYIDDIYKFYKLVEVSDMVPLIVIFLKFFCCAWCDDILICECPLIWCMTNENHPYNYVDS